MCLSDLSNNYTEIEVRNILHCMTKQKIYGWGVICKAYSKGVPLKCDPVSGNNHLCWEHVQFDVRPWVYTWRADVLKLLKYLFHAIYTAEPQHTLLEFRVKLFNCVHYKKEMHVWASKWYLNWTLISLLNTKLASDLLWFIFDRETMKFVPFFSWPLFFRSIGSSQILQTSKAPSSIFDYVSTKKKVLYLW